MKRNADIGRFTKPSILHRCHFVELTHQLGPEYVQIHHQGVEQADADGQQQKADTYAKLAAELEEPAAETAQREPAPKQRK